MQLMQTEVRCGTFTQAQDTLNFSKRLQMGAAGEKKKKFEELMNQDFVLVHLDARCDGVTVPDSLAGNASLTLKLSYAFQGETTADDYAVKSFLKFDGQYFECVLPWEAVWGMTASDNQQAIWPEDLPKEVMLQIAKQQFKALGSKLFGTKDSEEKTAAPKPALHEVSSEPDSENLPEKKEKKGKAPHLRLIK